MTNTPSEWQHSTPREAVPGVYGQGQGWGGDVHDPRHQSMVQAQYVQHMLQAGPDPIVEANREALLQRSRVGLKKYGCTLEGLSPRAGLEHALEEVLDLANYLRAVLVRMDAMEGVAE